MELDHMAQLHQMDAIENIDDIVQMYEARHEIENIDDNNDMEET
jgi:hypothetical protein